MNWSVDRDGCTAQHTTGLVFRFTEIEPGVWHGEAENLREWAAAHPDLIQQSPALAREAGEAFTEPDNE